MEVKNNPTMEIVILETAERLFLEKGFAMTSTTEIAKEIGCNQALIHYYYRTKENLFNIIFEKKFKQFFQNIFILENLDQLAFLDKLKHIIEAHFDMVRQNPRIPLLIVTEFSRNPEMVATLKEKLQGVVTSLFESLNTDLQAEIAAGRVRQITIIDLIFTVISINISLFLLLPVAAEIMTMDEKQKEFVINRRRDEHVKLILNGIRS
ncbi:MAG: TetR/AcrR family transcriptional regulator [Paludibacter sp.]|jgi:TetR/AcrR family transcriptional regulator